MDSSRLWRLAAACRRVFHSMVLIVGITAPVCAADAIAGLVVDQAGQPLSRAFVRTLDASNKETGSTFTDEAGHFNLGAAASPCRVDVSMHGFSRTVTVELLLIQSSRVLGSDLSRPAFGHEHSMLRKNNGLRQPCYTPAVRPNPDAT